MSFAGSVEAIHGRRARAVDERDADALGTVDDVEGGEDRAGAVDDHAGAEAGVGVTRRRLASPRSGRGTAGSAGTRVADAGGFDSRSSIAFSTTSEAIFPTSAWSSGGGDVSRLAT